MMLWGPRWTPIRCSVGSGSASQAGALKRRNIYKNI
jgi:hypothetical protein